MKHIMNTKPQATRKRSHAQISAMVIHATDVPVGCVERTSLEKAIDASRTLPSWGRLDRKRILHIAARIEE